MIDTLNEEEKCASSASAVENVVARKNILRKIFAQRYIPWYVALDVEDCLSLENDSVLAEIFCALQLSAVYYSHSCYEVFES